MTLSKAEQDAFALAAVAAARDLHPRGMVCTPALRVDAEDLLAEPLVRAFVLDGPAAVWFGVTEFTTAMLGEALLLRAQQTVALFLRSLGALETRERGAVVLREATLDERELAIAPQPDRDVVTVTLDVKLAQLMSTTLGVLDVVRGG